MLNDLRKLFRLGRIRVSWNGTTSIEGGYALEIAMKRFRATANKDVTHG